MHAMLCDHPVQGRRRVCWHRVFQYTHILVREHCIREESVDVAVVITVHRRLADLRSLVCKRRVVGRHHVCCGRSLDRGGLEELHAHPNHHAHLPCHMDIQEGVPGVVPPWCPESPSTAVPSQRHGV